MKANELVSMVHKNAVRHGWWGDMKDGKEEERSYGELLALIHSEWSEALEEYRAGRPMEWYKCKHADGETPCSVLKCCLGNNPATCEYLDGKPEGIAVELIDGVIRILDMFGHYQTSYPDDMEDDGLASFISDKQKEELRKQTLPEFINYLHTLTARTGNSQTELNIHPAELLVNCVSLVFCWITEMTLLDPMKLLIEEHKYNESRPYKHGKVC